MSWISRGLASALALVLLVISYVMLDKYCSFKEGDIAHAQHLHMVAGALALAGVCLHVLMLRGCLKNPLCRIVTAGIQLACAGGCIAAAYFVFFNPCQLNMAFAENAIRNFAGEKSNIFKVEDTKSIIVFILDICAALIVGGSTFLRSS